MIMPGWLTALTASCRLRYPLRLALVPQRLVGGRAARPGTWRCAWSKSAWSVLQTSSAVPSVRYVGTLPEPSGAWVSRSSCADAGAAGLSAIRAMPNMMAVRPKVHRLMPANPRSRPASAQRSPSAVGRRLIILRSGVVPGPTVVLGVSGSAVVDLWAVLGTTVVVGPRVVPGRSVIPGPRIVLIPSALRGPRRSRARRRPTATEAVEEVGVVVGRYRTRRRRRKTRFRSASALGPTEGEVQHRADQRNEQDQYHPHASGQAPNRPGLCRKAADHRDRGEREEQQERQDVEAGHIRIMPRK